MVKDYERNRTLFWSKVEDELYGFVMYSLFYNEINEKKFVRVMNHFMDYEEMTIFDNLYITEHRQSEITAIRDELLDYFFLYCKHYPEFDVFALLTEFKNKRVFTSISHFETFQIRICRLLE